MESAIITVLVLRMLGINLYGAENAVLALLPLIGGRLLSALARTCARRLLIHLLSLLSILIFLFYPLDLLFRDTPAHQFYGNLPLGFTRFLSVLDILHNLFVGHLLGHHRPTEQRQKEK